MTRFSQKAERLFSTLETTLAARDDALGLKLLRSMTARGRQNPDLAEAIETYSAAPGTLALKKLIAAFEPPPSPKIKDQLDAENAFAEIDAAQLVADTRMEALTDRTFEGRLFPAEDFGQGWSLSLQGDKAGYACAPRERLEHLEDYDQLEGVIYGPGDAPVSIADLGLPARTAAKFEETYSGGVAVGAKLTWDDINEIKIAISYEVERAARREADAASDLPQNSPEI